MFVRLVSTLEFILRMKIFFLLLVLVRIEVERERAKRTSMPRDARKKKATCSFTFFIGQGRRPIVVKHRDIVVRSFLFFDLNNDDKTPPNT